jgi:hypothetical protein
MTILWLHAEVGSIVLRRVAVTVPDRRLPMVWARYELSVLLKIKLLESQPTTLTGGVGGLKTTRFDHGTRVDFDLVDDWLFVQRDLRWIDADRIHRYMEEDEGAPNGLCWQREVVEMGYR